MSEATTPVCRRLWQGMRLTLGASLISISIWPMGPTPGLFKEIARETWRLNQGREAVAILLYAYFVTIPLFGLYLVIRSFLEWRRDRKS